LARYTRQPEQAIASYQEAIAILRKIGDRPSEGTALSNSGMALFETGRAEEAETVLLDAIATWESLRSGLSDSDQTQLGKLPK